MPQNRESGAAASRWGSETARLIAGALGAKMISDLSNEAIFHNQRIVIKSARRNTTNVGVSFKMLERLDGVVGAFEQHPGSFQLWSLTPQQYRLYMRDTASKGRSAGKVGVVSKSIFLKYGKELGNVTI